MKILYCDASFDWKHTDDTKENFVRGKVAISDGKDFNHVDKVVIGKVEGLKQYINVLELTALARAIELAAEMNPKPESLRLNTDSQVAMFWARAGRIKKAGIETEAHVAAFEYLKRARLLFQGIVTFNHVLRSKNPAGWLLEAELDKEVPHTV